MTARSAPALVACLFVWGCTPKSAPDNEAAPSAAAGSSSAAPSASEPSPVTTSPKTPARRPPRTLPLEQTPIAKLVIEPGGRWVAELDRKPPLRAWLTVSTRERPLDARARGAHARISELLAPGLAAPTVLRSMTVKELVDAADPATRSAVQKKARVLANGTVEVALSLAPADHLLRVELPELGPEARVTSWETALGGRAAVPEREAPTLAAYQALLAVDYVAGNLIRRAVHLHEKSGRLTAAEDNEAFSMRPREGALSDGLTRLSRHMTYSKKLYDRLGSLDRAALEKALRWGDPETLLSTPKQVDEALDRARAIRRLMDQRVKQRTEPQALALP